MTTKINKKKGGFQSRKTPDAELHLYPFVSICTPTFNRRPFFPIIKECFLRQTYPQDRMEWIIIDDGSDPIDDLCEDIRNIKYYRFDEKMTLGKKRNLMHAKSRGDILIYFDDDDYYPPRRVSHAVEMLQQNKSALCAGSSEMYIFFKHIMKMYKFGPYGPNHATAATFAFRRELLQQTSYEETACLAEEKAFLKNYTIPFVQLDPLQTILVFSHVQNSFDKKLLLESSNAFVNLSNWKVEDFVSSERAKKFFMQDIDVLLSAYRAGDVANKPDVLTQLEEMKAKREKQQLDMKTSMDKKLSEMCGLEVAGMYERKLSEANVRIHQLLRENQEIKNQMHRHINLQNQSQNQSFGK